MAPAKANWGIVGVSFPSGSDGVADPAVQAAGRPKALRKPSAHVAQTNQAIEIKR
jgi:hypothetical protein